MTAFNRNIPSLDNECSSFLCHESTLDSLMIFKGRSSSEITEAHLRKAWDAFGFFESKAYAYYLPALMRCSIESFGPVHLAVLQVVKGISNRDAIVPQKVITEELNSDELIALFQWLESISDGAKQYGFSDLLEEASKRVEKALFDSGGKKEVRKRIL